MKKTLIRKYARLIARTGANIQKGQPVKLYINADQYEFAAVMADECYKAGACRVEVEWDSLPLTKLHVRYQSEKSLGTVHKWEEERLRQMTEELPCRIFIISDDPDGLRGINQEKLQRARQARYKITKPYRDAMESEHQWTIAAIPSVEWAKKVFPSLSKNAAKEKLWQLILSTVMVTEDNDPEKAWREHNESLKRRCEKLNACGFDYLQYKSPNGTDFRAWLIPEGRWCGGSEDTRKGITFNPNLPTEEIFTSPMSGKCEGTLVATKPLSYEGELIENFSLTFTDGKVSSCRAEKGQSLLEKMIAMDEGAAKLGELALIDRDSPINRSGVLFYETLFDENASCHVALGRGFNDCIDGYSEKTNEECIALGINDSMIHVDFMIGSDELSITGFKDGKATEIFVNGKWSESF